MLVLSPGLLVDPDQVSARGLAAALAPLAAAIVVFGVAFGAAASAEFGAELALAMSLVVFSGAVQFAALGMVAGGAAPAAVVLAALALNARNLVLGAVLRQRLQGGSVRRAALGWFLVDESFGLAIAAGRRAGVVLVVAGTTCYLAWQLGTVLGVAGARFAALEGIAQALFPVLFIGLAAMTARGPAGAVRTAAAAVLVSILSVLLPAAHAFLPIVAALAVALPGRRSP